MQYRCGECGRWVPAVSGSPDVIDADLDYICMNVLVSSGDGGMRNFGNICRNCLDRVLVGVEVASVDNGEVPS